MAKTIALRPIGLLALCRVRDLLQGRSVVSGPIPSQHDAFLTPLMGRHLNSLTLFPDILLSCRFPSTPLYCILDTTSQRAKLENLENLKTIKNLKVASPVHIYHISTDQTLEVVQLGKATGCQAAGFIMYIWTNSRVWAPKVHTRINSQ